MSTTFSEKEEKILKTFEKTIPKMTELEREKLLSFGEGILFVKEKDGKEDKSAQREDEKDEINLAAGSWRENHSVLLYSPEESQMWDLLNYS